MALLSAIFSLIARQLSTILQAIFGWSVTSLFGKLPSRRETALSAALLCAIVWPFLVLGCFLPGAAAWAIALVPVHKWVSDFVLRIVWLALAVLVPIGVGAITRWITPKEQLRGSVFRTLLGGYILTVAYFVAFFVTALTVPIVKLLSAIHRWADTHVYLQAKEGAQASAVEALAQACKRAGIDVVLRGRPAADASGDERNPRPCATVPRTDG